MIDQQKNRETTMETENNSQTLSVGVIGTGGDDAVEFISKSSSSQCSSFLELFHAGFLINQRWNLCACHQEGFDVEYLNL